jgi:NTE family protein
MRLVIANSKNKNHALEVTEPIKTGQPTRCVILAPGTHLEMAEGRIFRWLKTGIGLMRDFAYPDAEHGPRRPRIGLALSGGFARGIAHIGVLRVLKEHHIPVDCISGTSVGALIGAAYAAGTSLEEMERQAALTIFTDFGRWKFSRLGLASNQKLDEFLARFTKCTRFEELKIPLAVAATELGAGKTKYFTRGDLRLAIRASCAYPGLFVPLEIEGSLLVDGFVTDPLPADGARLLGADVVIGVYLSTVADQSNPTNVIDVLGRTFTIVQQASEQHWRQMANVVIEPNVAQFAWDGFSKTPDLIAAGEVATRAALPAIRRSIFAHRHASI